MPSFVEADGRGGQARGAEELVVAGGAVAALLVPFGKVAQLDLENGGLDRVEAGVPADLVVVVAAGHAVGAQRAGVGGELWVGGGDQAGVAEGGEVFGGVEAEGGGSRRASQRAARPAGRVHAAPKAWAASSSSSSPGWSCC